LEGETMVVPNGEEDKGFLNRVTVILLLASLILLIAKWSQWSSTPPQHGATSEWSVINITVAGRNITVYYANTADKISEGYKNKDSYDFAGKGAVGILLPLYNLDTTRACFTMRDVKLDLILVVARKTHFDYKIVEKIYMPRGSSDICIDTGSTYIKYETIAIEIDPSKSHLFPLDAIITLPEVVK